MVCNLLQAYFTPITEDEAYYWVWSQHLALGYFDHPPMVAWWVALGYEIFPNQLGVRLLTALSSGLVLWILWKILKPQTSNQIKLFGLASLSLAVFHLYGFITTPDAPLMLFTVLYLWALQKFTAKQETSTQIFLGFTMAGLLYSKYHGVLVIGFTLLPLLWEWRKYINGLWKASLVAFILFIPHLLWLFMHDFIPVQYHFSERSSDESFELRKLNNYLLMAIFGAAPLLFVAIWKSILKYNHFTTFHRSVWLLAMGPVAFFFFTIFKDNVQPQWLLISFIAMIILLYWNYEEKLDLKWIYIFGILNILGLIAGRIAIATPSITPFAKYENFAKNVAEFQPINPIFEKYQEASLYQFYNPKSTVAVHRTLGNRRSQFDLWQSEDQFFDQTVTYISPWVVTDTSFIGFKNRPYYLKKIENFKTAQQLEIKTMSEIVAQPKEVINLGLKLKNHHDREIFIGGNADLQFSVNYYVKVQHDVVYSQIVKISQIELEPNEELDVQISFENIDQAGEYKMAVGIYNKHIGTTYLSKPINVVVE